MGLEILGRREDGFHEIRSIFARLELHDTLTIRPAAELGVRWPAGMLAPPDDLIRRAATLLRQFSGTALGARITLEKRIPMAGGLGGGSADAAATLFALNEVWRTGLSAAQLARLGAQLGSDVPSFFSRAPALVHGRGECAEPIETPSDMWVVLVAPNWEIESKTTALYGLLTPVDFSDGAQVDRTAALMGSAFIERIEPANAFERVIDRMFPHWSDTRAELERASGARFWLTGAGPCLYALFSAEPDAQQVLEAIAPLQIPALTSRVVEGMLRVE